MSKPAPRSGDPLRMKSADFDLVMQKALGVAAPKAEPKPKTKAKKRVASKKPPTA